MALNFENEIPEWKNSGVEPSNELRTKGFTGGYKPPATVFNWFWSLVQKCITELQTKLKTHADSTSNPHNVTKAQIGLGKVDNTADKDKNVLSATKLTTARKINNVSFNGTSDITVDIVRYRIQGTADNRYDLNNVITPGEYWGAGGNFAINFPEYDADKKPNIGGFALKVYQSGGLGRLQVFINDVCMWFRVSSNVDIESNTAIWKDWICLSKVGHTHSNTEITGLGNCATRNLATTVAQGNANPVTSSAVYSAISNIKTNNRTHIVIATYDTKNPLKSNADYTCTETNATDILKQAIISIGEGGKIELLDGTYNLSYSAGSFNIYKSITIEGQGFKTVINQPADTVAGETMPIFDITAANISIRNMMLSASRVTSPAAIITQSAQGAIYDNVFFIRNTHESEPYSVCIEGTGDCKYTRIQNCRVYKDFKGESVMFDYLSCTDFSGVIGANISSGYDNIGIRFKNETHKNATAIYGHSNIDIKTKEV